MSAMRVLVTGATGFLGSRVAGRFADRGDDVRVLARATSDQSRLEAIPVEVALGDVTDRGSVVAAVDGCDLVVHCAAMVEFGPRDPSRLQSVNVQGARNVLDAAAGSGIRTVHVSSLSALGPTEPGEPPKDESWWFPGPLGAVYEETKREAHLHARELIEGGAPLRIVMPGGIYGYGDQSTMADLIRAYALWPLPLGYLPEIRQSTVDVDDCADAIVRVADDDRDGEEYVVSAETTSVADWVTIIARAGGHRGPVVNLPARWVTALGGPGGKVAGWLGQSPTMVPETVAVATHDSAYLGDKLRRELGWSPRSLADGMQRMVDAIKADEDARRQAKRAERAARRAQRAGP